jgi:hypothetical protein
MQKCVKRKPSKKDEMEIGFSFLWPKSGDIVCDTQKSKKLRTQFLWATI